MAQLPKGGLVRGHGKPIHGSCAIYFPGGIMKCHNGLFHAAHVTSLFWGSVSSRCSRDPNSPERWALDPVINGGTWGPKINGPKMGLFHPTYRLVNAIPKYHPALQA